MNEAQCMNCEYSVIYDNGHRVTLRDYEDAERMQKLTRGRVEWRTQWKPFDAHPLSLSDGERD